MPNSTAVSTPTPPANSSSRPSICTWPSRGTPAGPAALTSTMAHQRQHRAEGHARGHQQRALRQQLTQQPPRAGTEGRPDRHFGLARGGAHQQQVGDVGAGQQQQATDAGQHHLQRRLDAADHQLAHVARAGDEFRVRLRVGRSQPRPDGVQLAIGTGGGGSAREPADTRHVVRAAIARLEIVRRRYRRRPEIGSRRGDHRTRGHADHGHRFAAEFDGPTDDAGSPPKRLRHNPSESTAVAGEPGWSAPAANPLPSSIGTPQQREEVGADRGPVELHRRGAAAGQVLRFRDDHRHLGPRRGSGRGNRRSRGTTSVVGCRRGRR